MRKKTICAMMTGFLAVQGIEVHAETQQTTGEAASAVESVELEAEIIENSDVTDADGKAGPEELLPDEKSEEEPPIEEKPEQEPEPPEEKTDPAETGKKEKEGEEKMLFHAVPGRSAPFSADGNSGSGERTSGKVGRRGERNFGRFRIGEARRIAGGRRYGFRGIGIRGRM